MCNCQIIPQHLHPTPSQVGLIDSNFSQNDYLHRRVPPATPIINEIGTRNADIIGSTENISCFWSKYSPNPLDSLFDEVNCLHLHDWQIIRFSVKKIEDGFNAIIEDDPMTKYTVGISHVPTDCIYSHCELHTFSNKPDYTDSEEIFALPSDIHQKQVQEFPKSLRSTYREFLVGICEIVR